MNGHWIKSQRSVKFPLEGLDPLRYTVQNGNRKESMSQAHNSLMAPGSLSSTEPMDVMSMGNYPCNQGASPNGHSNEVDKAREEHVEGVADGTVERMELGGAVHVGEHSADSTGAESDISTATSAQDQADYPKLYNLFAISVSACSQAPS